MNDLYQLGAIKDADYEALLEALVEFDGRLGFIVAWPMSDMLNSTRSLIRSLSRAHLEVRYVKEWPGTRSESFANQYLVKFDSSAKRAVIDAAPSLFSWQHPLLPQDVHILRDDGSVIFGSVTGDGRSWLDVSANERSKLQKHGGISELFDRPRVARFQSFAVPLGEIGSRLTDAEFRDRLIANVNFLSPMDREGAARYLHHGELVFPRHEASKDLIGGLFAATHGNDIYTDGHVYWRGDLEHYVLAYGLRIEKRELDRMRLAKWEPSKVEEARLDAIFYQLLEELG